MTSDRARAYGRLMHTIEEVGPSKLQPVEVARLREAADTLLFSEDPTAPGVREALDDVESLARHLEETERWTEERAAELVDAVAECGPLAHVG